jgi:hypothetical protein
LCFNHEEFCDVLKAHHKTLAFAFLAVSGGLFESRVALSAARTAALRSSR